GRPSGPPPSRSRRFRLSDALNDRGGTQMSMQSRRWKLGKRSVIGSAVGVIGSLVIAGPATAAVNGQTYKVQATPAKQDKSVRGPVGAFSTSIDTVYTP